MTRRHLVGLLGLLLAIPARAREPAGPVDPCALHPAYLELRATCEKGEPSADVCSWLPAVDHLLEGETGEAAKILEGAFDLPVSAARGLAQSAGSLVPVLLDSITCPVSERPAMGSIFEAFGSFQAEEYVLTLGQVTEMHPDAWHQIASKIEDDDQRLRVERATAAFAGVLRKTVGLARVKNLLASTFMVGRSPKLPPPTHVWEESLAELVPHLEALDRALERSRDDRSIGRRFERLAEVVRATPPGRVRAFAWTRAGAGLLLLGRPIEAYSALAWGERHFRQLDLGADPVANLTRFFALSFRYTAAFLLQLFPELVRLQLELQEAPPGLPGDLADQLPGLVASPEDMLRAVTYAFEGPRLEPEAVEIGWQALQIVAPGTSGTARAVEEALAVIDQPPESEGQPLLFLALAEAWHTEGLGKALEVWQEFAYRSPHWTQGIWPLTVVREAAAREDFDMAHRGLDMFISFLEVGLDPLFAEELVRSLLATQVFRFFTASVDIAYGLEDEAAAFHYAERGRAFSLRRLLGVPPDFDGQTAAGRDIEARLVALELEDGPEDDLDQLRADFASARLEHRVLEPKTQLPDFPSPIDVETLQSGLLEEDETLIAYFPGVEKMHLFVVRAEGFEHVELPWPLEELPKVTERVWQTRLVDLDFEECTEVRRRSAGVLVPCPEDDLPADPTRWLFDRLLAPAGEHLPVDGRLIVVPYGPLHRVPWAALQDSEGRWLVESVELSVVPSADILATLRRRSAGRLAPDIESAPGHGALVLGDPASHLEALPEARREALAVADFLGAKALLGPDASEEALRFRAPSVRLLHVAAHGVFEPGHPLFSRLQLASGGEHDGFLFVHEIWDDLDLRNLRLVALSACDTATGEASGGDDIVGLTQAFLVAGSPAVVATLWPVHDEASASLMRSFYGHFRGGASAGEALRRAQLEMLEAGEHAAPYYWAGYTIVGDARARWDAPSEVSTAEGSAVETAP